MKLQRCFAPISGEFAPESVARFIGIRIPFKVLAINASNMGG